MFKHAISGLEKTSKFQKPANSKQCSKLEIETIRTNFKTTTRRRANAQ